MKSSKLSKYLQEVGITVYYIQPKGVHMGTAILLILVSILILDIYIHDDMQPEELMFIGTILTLILINIGFS